MQLAQEKSVAAFDRDQTGRNAKTKVSYEDDILNGNFNKTVNEIDLSHINKLSVDIYALDDLALCDFLDYMCEVKTFKFTMELLVMDVTNARISNELKKYGSSSERGCDFVAEAHKRICQV